MRIWSLHPRYLDAAGLVALWREGLLLQQVLLGRTRGYRRHPQVTRFREAAQPLAAAAYYLRVVLDESRRRGYAFDEERIFRQPWDKKQILVSRGQLLFEVGHLQHKLAIRSPEYLKSWPSGDDWRRHPLFQLTQELSVEPWERGQVKSAGRSANPRFDE